MSTLVHATQSLKKKNARNFVEYRTLYFQLLKTSEWIGTI